MRAITSSAAAGIALLVATAAGGAERGDGELGRLVHHDCGSCHGLALTGGLGPPITAAALAGKPPEWVRAVILEGVPGTAMPPWRGLVSEAEAARIAKYLKEDKARGED